MANKNKIYLLIGISIVAFVAVLCLAPVMQDPAFHNFADGREIASIKNCMNVVSNIPFMLIGTAGLWMIIKRRPNGAFEELQTSSIVFLVGIFFTGIGSAFYHWNPNDSTLVWDRLPMTISFMAFFSIVISTLIDQTFGKRALWPFISFGLFSIFYWDLTGDLRLYIIVQFLPILLIPLILLFFLKKNEYKKHFWLMVICYGVAKLFEASDYSTFQLLNCISGHSLKHLFAALVPGIFLLSISRKERIKESL